MRILTHKQKGFSLVEMMVTVVVFGIIATVATGAFISQLEHNSREYNLAEAEIESNIAINKIIRTDIVMAGYGLANDYSATGAIPPLDPPALRGVDQSDGDELFLAGTALGFNARADKSWSYWNGSSFAEWTDPRENLVTNPSDGASEDAFVFIDANSKRLLADAEGQWLFRYQGKSTLPEPIYKNNPFDPPDGALAYGLQRAGIKYDKDKDGNSITLGQLTPYYTVRYYLGDSDDPPDVCAPGTKSLLRAETYKVVDADQPKDKEPLLACVLNFQVAFGLDTDENGSVDLWDDGGQTYEGYSSEDQRQRIKQVRLYLLMQQGRRDPDYQHPTPKIQVGDKKLAQNSTIGEEITLTKEQENYRWRLLTLSVTPRNIYW